MEAVRPFVDSWLLAWLSTARFSKRDFYEEGDGTIRLTRPLTSHLAMTSAIWRPAAQSVAGWLARALGSGIGEGHRLPPPLPALPAPRQSWQGGEAPVIKTCHECGNALTPKQQKFCSEACAAAFHVAITAPAELAVLADGRSGEDGTARDPGAKNRRHSALRRAWDAEHAPAEGQSAPGEQNSWSKANGPAVDRLRQWYETTLAPLLAARRPSDIQAATGLTKRYAIMIRQGYAPHPRHYSALAGLVGIEPPRN